MGRKAGAHDFSRIMRNICCAGQDFALRVPRAPKLRRVHRAVVVSFVLTTTAQRSPRK